LKDRFYFYSPASDLLVAESQVVKVSVPQFLFTRRAADLSFFDVGKPFVGPQRKVKIDYYFCTAQEFRFKILRLLQLAC